MIAGRNTPSLKERTHNPRIHWIDLLESIAIFMVILYHGPLYSYNFHNPAVGSVGALHYFFNTILSTCVPLFFFANGYLLFSKKMDLKKHFSKVLRLVALVTLWSAITVFILMFINQEFFGIKEFLKNVWYRKMWWNHHLWFIGSLVMVYIFFPLLKNAYDTNKKAFFYFTAVVAFLTFGNTLLNHLLNTGKFFLGAPINADGKNYFDMFNPFYGIRGWVFVYFCLGGIAYHYKDKILQIPPKTRNIISSLGIIISCLGLFGLGLVLSTSLLNEWPWDVVFKGYDSIFTLFNVIFIYILCLNYKANNRFIALVSRNTLGIYFIHMIIIKLTCPYMKQIDFLCNLPGSLIYSFAVLCISLGISVLIQKIPIVKKIL